MQLVKNVWKGSIRLYCSLIWDDCANKLKTGLQKLQSKAACVITGQLLLISN